MKIKRADLKSLARNWPSSFVSRDKVAEFSGGMIHPRTICNHDALGTGPKGRIRVGGKKIAYPVDELIRWLEERSEIVGEDE